MYVHVIIHLAKLTIITPHVRRERGKVISVGVHILWTKKNLNCTLAIDSPFKHSQFENTSFSESK